MEAHYGKQTFIIALFSILEHYVFQRKARKEFSQPHQYQLLWLQKKNLVLLLLSAQFLFSRLKTVTQNWDF